MTAADNQNSDPAAPPGFSHAGRWDTLLVDVNLATMADPDSFGIIENAAIGMLGGRICGLGPMNSLPAAPDALAADVIECGGVWVTPGLIDCHTRLISPMAATDDASMELAVKWLLALMKEGVTCVASLAPAQEEAAKAIRHVARLMEERYPVYVYPDIADTQAPVDATTTPAQLDQIQGQKKTAVLLPAAYYLSNLMQLPPIDGVRRRSIPMALATGCDPLTMPATSILLVLNMACRLFGLAPHEALHGLTTKAAQAMGVADDVGMLLFGKIADLALWDIKHPSELSYHLGRNPCMGVFKSGVLYKLEG